MYSHSLNTTNTWDLARLQLPLTATKGINYLTSLNQKIVLLALYQHYFPNEWASSTASYSPPLPSNSWRSDREIEFLTLVNERLFPIDDCDGYIDGDGYDNFDIPLCPQNKDWSDLSIEELSFAEQFILSLLGYGYDTAEEWLEVFGFIPSNLLNSNFISWEKLSENASLQAEPLSFLYDVLSQIDHSTGIIWLDIGFQELETISWSRESIDLLTEQWQIAKEYIARMQQFEDWLQKDVSNRKKVVQLWNQAKS